MRSSVMSHRSLDYSKVHTWSWSAISCSIKLEPLDNRPRQPPALAWYGTPTYHTIRGCTLITLDHARRPKRPEQCDAHLLQIAAWRDARGCGLPFAPRCVHINVARQKPPRLPMGHGGCLGNLHLVLRRGGSLAPLLLLVLVAPLLQLAAANLCRCCRRARHVKVEEHLNAVQVPRKAPDRAELDGQFEFQAAGQRGAQRGLALGRQLRGRGGGYGLLGRLVPGAVRRHRATDVLDHKGRELGEPARVGGRLVM